MTLNRLPIGRTLLARIAVGRAEKLTSEPLATYTDLIKGAETAIAADTECRFEISFGKSSQYLQRLTSG
jgi:hypothetical protein